MQRAAAPTGHVMVWIDHNEARIFQYDDELEAAGSSVVRSARAPVHLHHKAGERAGSGHLDIDHAYLEQVTAALGEASHLLVAGPASAKHELMSHLSDRHPGIAARVVGVETLDHPGDGQLQDFGRTFFRRADHRARLGATGLGGS